MFNLQVASDTPEVNKDKEEKLLMLFAEAMKAVEVKGGPTKILQDPGFKYLPHLVQRVIVNLLKMVEGHKQGDESEIQSRTASRLTNIGGDLKDQLVEIGKDLISNYAFVRALHFLKLNSEPGE